MKNLLNINVVCFVITAIVGATVPAMAEEYPTKPIRFVVSFPPGGSSDLLARLLGEQLSQNFMQPVVIDNRPGGGSIIGTNLAAKAVSDGYTILLIASSFAINASFRKKELPYDTIKDFAPVSLIAKVPLVLVVKNGSPYHSIQDVVSFAKRAPGKLNFGSGGNGGSPHLAGELFKTLASIDIAHIPYKGVPPALTDLLGGRLDLVFANLPVAMTYINSGALKALAVTDIKRSPVLSDVPTMSESGIQDYEAVAWYGIVGPAGIENGRINRLSREIAASIKIAELRRKFTSLGAQPETSTPEEFRRLINSEIAKWAEVLKVSGATVN